MFHNWVEILKEPKHAQSKRKSKGFPPGPIFPNCSKNNLPAFPRLHTSSSNRQCIIRSCYSSLASISTCVLSQELTLNPSSQNGKRTPKKKREQRACSIVRKQTFVRSARPGLLRRLFPPQRKWLPNSDSAAPTPVQRNATEIMLTKLLTPTREGNVDMLSPQTPPGSAQWAPGAWETSWNKGWINFPKRRIVYFLIFLS